MKQIPNYPGYFVTEDGRVWSERTNKGHGPGKFLVFRKRLSGRLAVSLSLKKGKVVDRYVHHLVLETYVGQCPEGMECRHLDGNPQNNRLENLCWGTHKDNELDKIIHNTHGKKLKEGEVRIIIYEYFTKLFTQKELGEMHGISRTHISYIVNRKTWKHIWKGLSYE